MFPITMSFTVSTPAELAKLVAATGGTPSPTIETKTYPDGTVATGVAPLPAETPKQEVKKADPKPEPAAASAAQPAATASSTTAEPTAAASGLDYDKDVKPAFLKLVQTKGRAAGRKIIDAFAPTKEKLSEAITTQEQYKQALDLIAKELA